MYNYFVIVKLYIMASKMSSTYNTKNKNVLPLNFWYMQSSIKFASKLQEVISMSFVTPLTGNIFKAINRFS